VVGNVDEVRDCVRLRVSTKSMHLGCWYRIVMCVETLQVTDATNMAMNALVRNVQVVRECVRAVCITVRTLDAKLCEFALRYRSYKSGCDITHY
jgi:hypothetical protein